MPTAVKRLLLVVVLAALVVGATGCDVSPPAASVNGASISQSTLNAELSSEIANPGAQCAALLEAGSSTSPIGVGTEGDGLAANAVTPSFADNALETLVLQQLETQALARQGVAVSHADLAAAATDYQSQLQGQLEQAQSESAAPSGCTLSATKSLSSQLPAAFLQRQGTSLADQEMFEVAVGHVNLSQRALESYYTAHLAQVTQECLNVVVADTQAAAQTLHNQIAAGTSFSTASTSADADQQVGPPGGELQCEFPSVGTQQFGTTLGATIDALSSGQLLEPQPLPEQSSTGATTTYYVVVQMRQHQLVPFATLRSSIRQAILTAHVAVVGTALNRLVKQAHVTIDPRYGSWSAKHGVTVPTPPAPAFVLNAKANVAAAPTTGLHLTIPS
jgi:hypothetical protein